MTVPITGVDDDGCHWRLLHDSGYPITKGMMIMKHDGVIVSIHGGRPPHKPSSTGRVWINEQSQEYFPNVFDMKWERVNEGENHETK